MAANLLSNEVVFIIALLRTCARRPKDHRRHARSELKRSDRLVALSQEQLALVTDHSSHGISFRSGLGKLVVPCGNAPQSSAYRAGALLLSYRTMADGVGVAPTPAYTALGFRDRGIAALPTIQMALAEGLSPPSPVLEAPRSML